MNHKCNKLLQKNLRKYHWADYHNHKEESVAVEPYRVSLSLYYIWASDHSRDYYKAFIVGDFRGGLGHVSSFAKYLGYKYEP